jgi:hypothetical protein
MIHKNTSFKNIKMMMSEMNQICKSFEKTMVKLAFLEIKMMHSKICSISSVMMTDYKKIQKMKGNENTGKVKVSNKGMIAVEFNKTFYYNRHKDFTITIIQKGTDVTQVLYRNSMTAVKVSFCLGHLVKFFQSFEYDGDEDVRVHVNRPKDEQKTLEALENLLIKYFQGTSEELFYYL